MTTMKTARNASGEWIPRVPDLPDLKRYLRVTLEPRPRQIGDLTVLPYRTFLQRSWDGTYY